MTNPDTRREKYFHKDRDQSHALLEQWLLERARQAQFEGVNSEELKSPTRNSAELPIILITVGDVFKLYLLWLKNPGKVHSIPPTVAIAKEFGQYISLKANLDTLEKMDFRLYREALWNEAVKKKRKRSHANRRIRIVRATFRRAYRESDRMLNGEAVCAMLSVLETRMEKDAAGAAAITPEEFHAVANADDNQWKAIMYMAMNCALGNTDIASLRMQHIDLENGIMHFARTKTEETVERPRRTPL